MLGKFITGVNLLRTLSSSGGFDDSLVLSPVLAGNRQALRMGMILPENTTVVLDRLRA